jgi:hypothetical protein
MTSCGTGCWVSPGWQWSGCVVTNSRCTHEAPAGRQSSGPVRSPGGQPVPSPPGDAVTVRVSGKTRPPFDPWRDVDGTPIRVGARVEQIGVAKGHGALRGRLHQRGEVIRRGHHTRLCVRFDDETELVSVRPHLLRVVT